MTIIEGQIESLKSIKKELSQKGIIRFNSIGDIRDFNKNFNSEKLKIKQDAEYDFELEIQKIQSKLSEARQKLRTAVQFESDNLNQIISEIETKIDTANAKSINSPIRKFFVYLPQAYRNTKLKKLRKNFKKILNQRTKTKETEVNKINRNLEEKKANREKIIGDRIQPKINEIDLAKEVVSNLDLLIAGAIGEDLVVKELQKLKEDFVLFNDFSLKFEPPLFNKKTKDRIHSIQIDHVLVSNSGIFVLETKNWSKESIKSISLKSPVEQIMRTSYALFVLFNSKTKPKKRFLRKHHWGEKQVPIRNIVVMINEKPKEHFLHVKVKTLKELNGYISFFEPIFDDFEVQNIADQLRSLRRSTNLG